jgi:hypothetical protein
MRFVFLEGSKCATSRGRSTNLLGEQVSIPVAEGWPTRRDAGRGNSGVPVLLAIGDMGSFGATSTCGRLTATRTWLC